MLMRTQDIEIIKHKAKGKTLKQIAEVVYPNQSVHAGEVSVSRRLKKAEVQTELKKELNRQGITLKKALKPIADGLEATKYAQEEGDFYNTKLPEHTTRLHASRMALDLLDRATPSSLGSVDSGRIAVALEHGNETDLLGVIFGKRSAENPTPTSNVLVDSKSNKE